MTQPNQNARPDISELPTPPSGFPMPVPRRSSRAPLWWGFAALLTCAAVAVALTLVLTADHEGPSTGRGFLATTSGTIDFTGTMVLIGGGSSDYSGGCQGTGGYGDIGDGAGVTVYDDSGKIVGTGHLAHSRLATSSSCEFDFTVQVPGDKPFYQVEVTHRGKVTYSAADVKAGKVQLSLGS